MKRLLPLTASSLAYFLTASTVFAQSLKPPGGSIPEVSADSIPQFVINWIFYIGIVLAVAYLMYGGIRWITSGGDKTKVESARKHIISAVIGLVVVVGTFTILNLLFSFLGADNPLKDGFKPPTLTSPRP